MQCVLQCPTEELITQKETRREFALTQAFLTLSSAIFSSSRLHHQPRNADSLTAVLRLIQVCSCVDYSMCVGVM